MRIPLVAVTLSALCASASVSALSLGKTSISAITPGYALAGQQNVVVVTGKNLSKAKSCQLQPTVEDLDATPTTATAAIPCASIEYITGTGQLEVNFVLVSKIDVNYILTLADASGNALALTSIHAKGVPANSTNPSPANGTQPSSSSQTGPFANCINGDSSPSALLSAPPGTSPPAVNCASSLLTEAEAKDNFGGHVSNTYYAIQVRISNQNSNYDFLLRDILLTLPDGRVVSGRIRRFAQGVAVKGRSLDARAAVYNALQAGTSLYGGLAVFASTGFKTVGNILQGSFLSGFAQIFPDYTADNVNRFNTAVFDDQNPAIVPKDSIGQPPLYVIALVPRPAGLSDPMQSYAQDIAVSIEGTFIKQVSLVALSAGSLDFNLEYVSPDGAAGLLAPEGSTKGLDALRDSGFEQKETISNNNSSPMNVSKVEIVPTSRSSSVSTGADFEFDTQKTDCGKSAGSGEFSPNNAFTIPAQSFCTLFVRFHPGGLGNAAANVQLQGSSLDGPTTFAITGKSVGLIVDTTALSLSGNPLATPVPFDCSYQSPCSLNLGTVALGLNPTLTVPVVLVSTGTTFTVTAVQDSNPAINVSSCKPSAESDVAAGHAALCILTLNLDSAKSSTILKITNSSPAWVSTITITYQTKPTMIVANPVSVSGQEGADIRIAGVVNDVTNAAAPLAITTGGTVTAIDEAGNKNTPATLSAAGAFSIDIGSSLSAGSYKYTLTYPENGSYEVAPQVSVPVTVTAPAVITAPAAISVKAGTNNTISLSVKTAKGTPCVGTLSLTQPAGPAVTGNVVAGSGSLSVNPPAPGSITEQLTFTPTSGFCTSSTTPLTYTATP